MNDRSDGNHGTLRMSTYRLSVVRIGIMAVTAASGLFAVLRYIQQVTTGVNTPWWFNALAFLMLVVLYRWFRRAPEDRVVAVVQIGGLISLASLLVPLAYGMASSVWWLVLIGFVMMLMANRIAALSWCAVTLSLMVLLPELMAHARPPLPQETSYEALISRLGFGVVLFGIAYAFRLAVRRQARELRDIAVELRSSNDTKERFLQHMGHELRTPLHGVIAQTDLLLHGQLEREQHARVMSAHASAKVLLNILNDVLEYSSGRSASGMIEHSSFSPRLVLEEVVASLTQIAEERQLYLRLQIDPGWREPRVGHAEHFRHIAHKLAGNALRFTDRGGVVLSLSADDAAGDQLCLSVTDTGVGMAEEFRSRLFHPFTQSDQSRTQPLGNLGLGLALVHDLARRLNGTIDVQSSPGQGSSFMVRLPMPLATSGSTAKRVDPSFPESATHASVAVSTDPKKLRVLVCEDDLVSLELMLASLETLGHEGTSAVNGEVGWERYLTGEFDLLLTDLDMPKLDGSALIRRIRSLERLRALPAMPVVAVTASASPAEIPGVQREEFDAWLHKPFVLADVRTVLNRLAQPRGGWVPARDAATADSKEASR